MRGSVRKVTKMARLKDCGWVAVRKGGTITARATPSGDGRWVAGFAGLSTCGSVWVCPVCSSKIARKRAEDLNNVLGWATEQGHTVAMVTLTMRHTKRHRLAASWDAASAGWTRVTGGGSWCGETDKAFAKRIHTWKNRTKKRDRPVQRQGIKQRFGVLGFARALEVTEGEHGWHVHLHIIMILEGRRSEEMVRTAGEEIYALWAKGLASKGYSALRDSGGLDIRTSAGGVTEALAMYLTKQLSIEATHGQQKEGRFKGRTPFQIVADFLKSGDADDLDRWHEWEQASKGRRQLTWSQGLREMAGLARELTDEEIAEAKLGAENFVMLPAATWRQIREIQVEFLLATEAGGPRGGLDWLNERGYPYQLPPKVSDSLVDP